MDLDDYGDDEITQVDCWPVITSFFDEKGLVGQQIESYDEFIHNTIQEIVDNENTVIHRTEIDNDEVGNIAREITVKFGQIYVTTVQQTDSDGVAKVLYFNLGSVSS